MTTGTPLAPTTDLLTRVRKIVTRVVLEGAGRAIDLTPETSLLDVAYLDSMAMVALVVDLQSEFGVEFRSDQMHAGNFDSIAAIANLVAARQAEARQASA